MSYELLFCDRLVKILLKPEIQARILYACTDAHINELQARI